MKKLLMSLSIFLLGSIQAAYAIVVGQYFTVENKTNQELRLKILSQPVEEQIIPANTNSIRVYSQGNPWMGQRETKPFYISSVDGNQVYVKGLIVFYPWSMGTRYSYLKEVSSAKNWEIDSVYTCKYEGNVKSGDAPFDNRIIIKKAGDLKDSSFNGTEPRAENLDCTYLKNSRLDNKFGNQAGDFITVECFDGSSATYAEKIYSSAKGNSPASYSWNNVADDNDIAVSNMEEISEIVKLEKARFQNLPESEAEKKAQEEVARIFGSMIGEHLCVSRQYAKPNAKQ